MALQDAAAKLLTMLFNAGQGNAEAFATAGTAVTVADPAVASISVITFSGSTCAITLPTPVVGKKKTLLLVQDATGSRLATWVTPSGAIKWVGGSAPTLTTTASKADRVVVECLDGTNWVAQAALNI